MLTFIVRSSIEQFCCRKSSYFVSMSELLNLSRFSVFISILSSMHYGEKMQQDLAIFKE